MKLGLFSFEGRHRVDILHVPLRLRSCLEIPPENSTKNTPQSMYVAPLQIAQSITSCQRNLIKDYEIRKMGRD
jgi:hypothetical protein